MGAETGSERGGAVSNRRHIVAAACAIALVGLLAVTGCRSQGGDSQGDQAPQEGQAAQGGGSDDQGAQGQDDPAESVVSTALVIGVRDDEVLLVDQATDQPYFPTLPEGAPQLEVGNVVRVTGNGIMLESYPGQYPGITKVEVTDEGSPEDAEKYGDIVSEVWGPRDPAEPARMTLVYQTEGSLVTLTPLRCGFVWSYGPQETRKTIAVDAPAATDYAAADLPDVATSGPCEVTASFDVSAEDVSVTSWPEGELGGEGSDVDVASADDTTSFQVNPGTRYRVTADFADGTVTYVFTVRAA